MKRTANKTKMFVITNYFLPIKIETIISLTNHYQVNQNINDFRIDFVKKDSSLKRNKDANDDLTVTYYNKLQEDKVYMSFYDNETNNVVVGTENALLFGNTKNENMYYPENINYKDYIKDNKYDTLGDFKVNFSLNKGKTFKNIDNRLEEFDIYNKQVNLEVSNAVFFYVFTYEDFLNEIEKVRKPNIYTYKYLSDDDFDELILQYNQNYFIDNILIFYYKYEPNISENYVYSITKKDNLLSVNINRYEGMLTALSSWFELITIKKTDIEGVNKVYLIVRTISKKVSSVIAYIKDDYLKEFYLNGKTLDDFKGLTNLKEIKIYKANLNVDIIINKEMTDSEFNILISNLKINQHIKAIVYKRKDLIRVQMNNNYFEKVVNKTLILNDFLDDETIETNALSISILNVIPRGSIEFVLDEKGVKNALKMIADLRFENYLFINNDMIF